MKSISRQGRTDSTTKKAVLVHTSASTRSKTYDYSSLSMSEQQAEVVANTKQFWNSQYNKISQGLIEFAKRRTTVTLEEFEFYLGMGGLGGRVVSLSLIQEWGLSAHIAGFNEALEEWLSQPDED